MIVGFKRQNVEQMLLRSSLILLLFFVVTYFFQIFEIADATTTITRDTDITDELSITGALSKGSGSFVIDHPLDPENKLLYHSFVESPDVKNIYDGIANLDENGEVVIELPWYFEELNTDYRYLVTPIGEPSPGLYLKKEARKNHFTIAGGNPGGTVSWQVTGIRKDPYILANPIITEVNKGPDALVEKGEFLHPEVYEIKEN